MLSGIISDEMLGMLLRMGLAVVIFGCAIESKWISNLIPSVRLRKVFYRVYVILFVFFAGRMVASVLDASLSFSLPIFGYIANYGFWIPVYWFYFHRQRKRLQSPQIGIDGRGRIADYIDGIIDEMTLTQDQLSSG